MLAQYLQRIHHRENKFTDSSVFLVFIFLNIRNYFCYYKGEDEIICLKVL